MLYPVFVGLFQLGRGEHVDLGERQRLAIATHALDAAVVIRGVELEPTLVGIGATALSDHSWGGNPIDGYALVRIYGSYQLTDCVKLHGRVENLFNRNYELSNFSGTIVDGAGTGLFAGITVDW